MKRGMPVKTPTRIVLGAVLAVLLGFSPASAEWYVGGYAGVASPNNKDVDAKASTGGIVLTDASLKDVDLETSPVFGVKVGYFFEGLPSFGLELEVYYLQPDAKAQTVDFSGTVLAGVFPIPVAGQVALPDFDINAIGIGLGPVYRLQLEKSDTFPKGRFNPYVGVGLGIFIASPGVPADKNTDMALGFQGLAGLKFFLIEHLALFAEYKFIQTGDVEFDLSASVGGTPTDLTLKTDFTMHTFYGGIAWHF